MRDPSASSARLMRQLGLQPRKRLGQNFLRDRRYLGKIIEAAQIGPEDVAVEVGAGTGILTEALAERCERLIAVELDDNLYDLLLTQFAENPKVDIIHANALDLDPCDLLASDSASVKEKTTRAADPVCSSQGTAQSSKLKAQSSYKLVANIPYYITGPLLRHFLEAPCSPSLLVLMVQKEVADRIAARPGEMSLLGVSVQYYAEPRIVVRVPASAFYPRPKVDSSVVRLVPHGDKPQPQQAETFFKVARAGFSTRRKQLVNALQNGLSISRETAADLLSGSGIDLKRRAETLSLEEWKRLAANYGAREDA